MAIPYTETRAIPQVRLRNDPLIGVNSMRYTRIKQLTLGPDLYGRPPVTLPNRWVTDIVHSRVHGMESEVCAYQLGGEWTIDPALNSPTYLKSTTEYISHASANYGLLISKNDVALYALDKINKGPIVALSGIKQQNSLPHYTVLFDELPFSNGQRAGVWATIAYDPMALQADNFFGAFGTAVVESIAYFPSAPLDIRSHMRINYHVGF